MDICPVGSVLMSYCPTGGQGGGGREREAGGLSLGLVSACPSLPPHQFTSKLKYKLIFFLSLKQEASPSIVMNYDSQYDIKRGLKN